MAKLFEEIKEIPKPAVKSRSGLRFSIIFAIILAIILLFMVIEKKREIDKENKNMASLVELLVMDNGNILTQKVKYLTKAKVDPEDTSDIFFEVVNGNEKYTKGVLIKFNHRFVQEQQIEGITYCLIDAAQVQFHIKKEDVKEDLLKR